MKKLAFTSGIVFLCSFSTLFTSCSKDLDLLAESVVVDNSYSIYNNQLLVNDLYLVSTNEPMVLDVLSNDSLIKEDEANITKTSEPKNGTVTINDDKTLTYIPNTNVTLTQNEQDSTSSSDSKNQESVVLDTENTSEDISKNQKVEKETLSDSFSYTVETVDSEGNKKTDEAIVEIVYNHGELKAFPGAEGFGKYAKGGRGGKVIYVTNLNDSGNGSLREAIEQSGPRTVVFSVSGYITINSSLTISNDNITIAGQTAPGDGITVRVNPIKDMACLRIKADDVIIRGMRFRPGPTASKAVNGDAMLMTSGERIMIDHCSFSWATDEILNPYGTSEITFQNCIFSEALMYATHAYTTDPSSSGYYRPHSMGMLVGQNSNMITIYNSIFAHNNQRNPLIGGSISTGTDFELVNNVYYNWGDFGTSISPDHSSYINLINNLHIEGPNSRTNRYPILLNEEVNVFAKGNINKFRPSNDMPEINALGVRSAPFSNRVDAKILVTEPFDYPLGQTDLLEPDVILTSVTDMAGAFTKDGVDLRIVEDIKNKTGKLINSPTEVGGYPQLKGGTPYLDTDEDGLSNEWEIKHNLDPYNPEDGNEDYNQDGYTNLEDFLHSMTIK
ncbi:Ig-like domain-containing protein [Zobellia sp. 1_MG-2023]|uniref:Ig-like domain-containing protein n=1 Tax=Zobellia sp. 1_MG-2023 TaxID=3062626 RepID=UPI0026E2CC57|nr:Ig-like domain-containing protein [Zobellia sp. 1_MG-2023]MDO6819744.1 Ig-like domain-containing protein [Zobellia sp. 1_MG-2023]